jgi:large subunit ribosomal protein L25
MENLNLNVEIRTTEEKLSELRATKIIPAVVYGKTTEPILLKMDNSDFLKTFRKSWESHIINLNTGKKEIEVLVHEIQREPITGDFLHIDFYAITRGEKVHTKIALNFTWESQAVKEWAILDEHIKELEVKVLPRNLVDNFEVKLDWLKEMWDSIKISDLNIDLEKFEILTADTVVVSASKPAKVEEISNEAPDAPVTGADEETTEA